MQLPITQAKLYIYIKKQMEKDKNINLSGDTQCSQWEERKTIQLPARKEKEVNKKTLCDNHCQILNH